jgi:2-oxoglutarate ferredoxin oxidoreductase subunit alpha
MSVQTTVLQTDVVLRLVGESGEGAVSIGDLTVKMLTEMGLEIYTYQTFPAEIKGGTVMYQIRAKSGPIQSEGDSVDILVALNDEGFDLFGEGLREDGILLYDADVFTPVPSPGRIEFGLEISSLAKVQKDSVRHLVTSEQLKRLPAPKNMVGLGALLRLLNAPLDHAEQYIRDLFGRKGEAIVEMNLRALQVGADEVAGRIGNRRTPRITPRERTESTITVNGNQMVSMGAIAAGMRFYAGYPITPASEIMEYMAKELPRFGGDLVQAEDEIAALGMCLGASYAGTKAMTASSGPGISLMVEQINLAGQSEIPVVIVDVQRGGASTGMPTKTSQGDLNLALYGVHNESPRIVLAASSVEDCFWTTIDAFNLAEAYQCPVLLLSDQAMSACKSTLRLPDLSRVKIEDRLRPTPEDCADGYMRYADTPTGISPMSVPGMPGALYVNTGIEHDEKGDPGYTPQLARQMKQKRFRKMETLVRERGREFVDVWGAEGDLQVGIIGFGSTSMVIQEAAQRAVEEGYKVGHLHVRMLNPLPVDPIEEFGARCRHILVPELNYSGQFTGWLRINTDLKPHSLRKDDGVPFRPGEIFQQILFLAGK